MSTACATTAGSRGRPCRAVRAGTLRDARSANGVAAINAPRLGRRASPPRLDVSATRSSECPRVAAVRCRKNRCGSAEKGVRHLGFGPGNRGFDGRLDQRHGIGHQIRYDACAFLLQQRHRVTHLPAVRLPLPQADHATTTGGLKVFSPTSEPRTASSRILTANPDTQAHDFVGHRAAQLTPRIVAFCFPEQDDDLLYAPKRSGSTGDGRKV